MLDVNSVTLIIDEAALQQMLTGPDGPVVRHLARVGAGVEAIAKRLLSGELVGVVSGRLRSSTTFKLFMLGQYPGVAIGSAVNYATYVHDGTRNMDGRPYLIIAAREYGLPITLQ